MKRIIKQKKICILSDSFPPVKNSAAGMIYNLAIDLKKDDFEVFCIYGGMHPISNPQNFLDYNIEGLELINSNILQDVRSKNNFVRFLFEFFLAFVLSFKIITNKNKLNNVGLIIWYGPSSFLWLPAFILKKISKSKIVYIVRDLFPDWLVSIGLIKKSVIYYFLKLLTFPQYIIPNFIGVESKSNLDLLKKQVSKDVELGVIHNWPSLNLSVNKKIKSKQNPIVKKIIKKHNELKKRNFLSSVYIGNTGYAQNFEHNIEYLQRLNCKELFHIDIFSPSKLNYNLSKNYKAWGGIDNDLIPLFISKKDFGIVSLHNDLFSNNLPGKFVSYVQFKLPVLSISNKNSELSKIISNYQCGEFIDINDGTEYNSTKLNIFLQNILNNKEFYSKNSNRVYKDYFDPKIIRLKIKDFMDK